MIVATVSILLVVATFIFYIFDPNKVSIFPPCPFLVLTGYECPGCGTQRAIHSLLHLRIGDALRYNSFIIFAIPYILLGVYLEYWGGKNRFPKLEKIFFGKYAVMVVLIGILAYWILRNI